MTFDKSKVCVAGLHDVPVGTRGYCAHTVYNLERSVTTEEKQAVGVLYEACDGYYFVEGRDYNFDCTMFYPLPEKQYRPYKTIEEALTLKGKWIKHKNWNCFIEVTKIQMLNGSALINDIDPSFLYKIYTMEDGTPVGVEV
jgi:hypothetical protein